MKTTLMIAGFFIAWFALLGILGVRRDGPGPAPEGIVDRALEGLAILKDWGKYIGAIAGGALIFWALFVWPYSR